MLAMPTTKNEYFAMRISPEISQMIRELADREQRSRSNLVRLLVIERYQAVKTAEKTNQPKRNQTANA